MTSESKPFNSLHLEGSRVRLKTGSAIEAEMLFDQVVTLFSGPPPMVYKKEPMAGIKVTRSKGKRQQTRIAPKQYINTSGLAPLIG